MPDAAGDRVDLDFRLRFTRKIRPADLTGSRIRVVDSDGSPPRPGDELAFQVLLRNAGDRPASDVVFRGEAPSWTRLIPDTVDTDRGAATLDGDGRFRVFAGTLEPGGVAWIDFRAAVRGDAPDGAWIVAGGRVEAAGLEAVPVLAEHSSAPGDPLMLGPVGGAAFPGVLSVMQTVEPRGPVLPGDRLRFETTVANSGDVPVADVALWNAVPLWTRLDPGSATTDRGLVDAGNPLRVAMGTLEPGESVRFAFAATVREDAPEHVRIAGRAHAPARGMRFRSADPAATDPEGATTARTAGPSPALRLWMESMAPEPGTEVGSRERFFRATVENAGTETIRDVRFLDGFPGPMALIPGSVVPDRGTVVQGSGAGDIAVEVALGELAPGESVRIRYGVRLRESGDSVFPFSGNPFPENGKPFLLFRNGWVRAAGMGDVRGSDPGTRTPGEGAMSIVDDVP